MHVPTDDLSEWLNQDYLTHLELAYWIPKYILMRGDKPFASLGTMSPRMRALAISQDKMGGGMSRKDVFPHIFTLSNTTTWLSQAAISMGPT